MIKFLYMRGKISDRARLQHILDAICEIENYTSLITIEDFSMSSEKKFASVKQLEIIGEAAGKITNETKSDHPEVEWTKIIALRNILVHEYYVIDENIVWDIITEDLPYLKEQIISLANRLIK
jgi:uncharacterized protein with HEPN domain